MERTNTRSIYVGNIQIGGQNKVVLQSMTNTKTKDVEATVNQINLLEKKFYLPEQDKHVTLKVSAHGLRVINKIGIEEALERATRNGFLK